MAVGADHRQLDGRQPAARRPQVEGSPDRARVDARDLQEQARQMDDKSRREHPAMMLAQSMIRLESTSGVSERTMWISRTHDESPRVPEDGGSAPGSPLHARAALPEAPAPRLFHARLPDLAL